ncbi:hypothetical protein [Armatimonas sp.]|uniref:hypothetical protein n=1 Tax=Armatimonas sp. TaxID=1872638 RepID=UPI0037531ED8
MQLKLPTTVRGFHDYYKLTAIPKQLVEAFGYGFEVDHLVLPLADDTLIWLPSLQERLEYSLRHFGFGTETPRREFVIAPILSEVARYIHADIFSEFVLQVNSQLKGALDYLVQSKSNLIVVEAKQADTARGFSQLCAEMIAMDQWTDSMAEVLYGAVSIGDMWRFGRLDRKQKRIVQDVGGILVPDDTEKLVRVLIAILRGETV